MLSASGIWRLTRATLIHSPLVGVTLLLAACSSSGELSLDTHPPELSVITPSAGTVLGRNGTATFRGSVTDDREVASVRLLDGGGNQELSVAALSERDEGAAFDRREWTIDWQPDGSGQRLLSLVAVDGAGNEARSDLPVLIGDFWFRDADGDGYGDPGVTEAALAEPDGYVATGDDCDDGNGGINPLAKDDPDLSFIDSNCDGIDGDILGSIFVSPLGSDSNPGTLDLPLASPVAALMANPLGSGMKKILIAAGSYLEEGGLRVGDGLEVYGGYDPADWSRAEGNVTRLVGTVQGVLAGGDTGVLLQLLTIEGTAGTSSLSVYGIRAIEGSDLTLERVDVIGGDAVAGADGAPGDEGAEGDWGYWGDDGGDSDDYWGWGGSGGYSFLDVDVDGGYGGDGGWDGRNGYGGERGEGTSGGAGGAGGEGSGTCSKGENGGDGQPGSQGSAGMAGAGGLNWFIYASTEWHGDHGEAGERGTHGSGGGGGGGGGGHSDSDTCSFTGSGGGGGGAGGEGGYGGQGGIAGGGSFGIYLWNSTLSISHGSTITTGRGGDGGDGGPAGPGGQGGRGGDGGQAGNWNAQSAASGGDGGKGGDGGAGGPGGGAAGGPSIGIFRNGVNPSLGDTTFTIGTPGKGGSSGRFHGQDGVAASLTGP